MTEPIKPNLLFEAAMPLLALMSILKRVEGLTNIENFRMKVLEEIKFFEVRLKESSYEEKTVLAARYCLCTALDESVFKTTWGGQSLWLQQGLLRTLHQESNGGEKFYLILEVFLKKPFENIDLLELIYFILNLGFKGKFYQDEVKLESIRQHLFRSLVGFKTQTNVLLQGKVKNIRPKSIHHFPLLLMIALTGSLLLGVSLHLKNCSKDNVKNMYTLIHKISMPVKIGRSL